MLAGGLSVVRPSYNITYTLENLYSLQYYALARVKYIAQSKGGEKGSLREIYTLHSSFTHRHIGTNYNKEIYTF